MRPPARPRLPELPEVPVVAEPPVGPVMAEPPVTPPVVPPVVPPRTLVDGPADEVDRPRWSPRRAPVVSTGSAARFAERVRMRRRIARDRVLVWTAAVVAALGSGWLLLASPVLGLHADQVQVRVDGDQAVVDVTRVQAILAGASGTPLPRLDTVGLRRQVLDVPGVRAASVSRAWPHGLLVTLVARDPVAAVPTDGGFALLDADGVQVGRADAAPEGLPVVDVPVGESLALTAVLVVLQQLPDALAADVVAVSAANQDAVELELADGATVEWGSADDSVLKAAVLSTLRAAPSAVGVRVYDVSAPTLPITRS